MFLNGRTPKDLDPLEGELDLVVRNNNHGGMRHWWPIMVHHPQHRLLAAADTVALLITVFAAVAISNLFVSLFYYSYFLPVV